MAHAKSRLANQLGAQAREALVFSLLKRTIRTFKSCLNPKDILIVGLDPDVERLAKLEGLSFLKEIGGGLNSALYQATIWATHHGFEAILISPLDLPFLA
jgi:2-phospho-L-lactate guanylyltransferase (CobY/MobA/RfbA family)